MKSQLILIALICLISFNGILASNLNRKSHKKARKWAEKDNCVCSSVSACDKTKYDLSAGREDGKGDQNNCSCKQAKRCECQANSKSGLLESDKKTACQCLEQCQQSNGAKVVEGIKEVGGAIANSVKSGLSDAKQALGNAGNAVKDAAVAGAQAVKNGAQAVGQAVVAGAIDLKEGAKDALDTCKCTGLDFSQIAKDSKPEQHKVSSKMRIRDTDACDCLEECSCPELTILKRRFNKLNKLHQTSKAQRLLDSLRASYNGTFKNGDKCTCDENMVNKAKALLASGVQGVKDAGKAIANGAKNAVNATVAAISNAADATKQLAGKAVDAAGKAVNAVADKAKAVGGAAVDALKSGVGAIGEWLAGDCIPDEKGFKAIEGKPQAPWKATGRQKNSNGLCEVEEKCQCNYDTQVDSKVNSTYPSSKLPCVCEIGWLKQKANQAKKALSGNKRLSKKEMRTVKFYCSTLVKDQCLNGCSYSEQQQKCLASKATLMRLAKSISSKKVQMNRNSNRFKQVPLDFQ